MDDDIWFFFFMSIAVCLLIISLVTIVESSDGDGNTNRLDNICHSLNAERVENTCIKDGAVVFKD